MYVFYAQQVLCKNYAKFIDNTRETPETIEESGVSFWSRVRESNPRHPAPKRLNQIFCGNL